MSIGSVLKPNDLEEIAVLPRSWLPTEKELTFCFCAVNKYGAQGEEERAEERGGGGGGLDSSVSRWLTQHKQQKLMWASYWKAVYGVRSANMDHKRVVCISGRKLPG